ncbi:MAG TPA: aldehyde dehydrogenase family protein [Candidatus Thermoplasmatota archaeon]|nr:aldehyde dehydrogenase family protein [Candidatus Thermoplasmatota archaeon]
MTAPGEKMYVDGAWVDAGDGATRPTVNPFDQSVVARVPAATEDDARQAIAAAHKAFTDPAWARMDPAERGRLLRKVAALIYERADDLARTETTNNGKPLREAKGDVLFAAQTFEYYAGFADKIEGSVIPVPGPRFNYTRREPLGVTVHIIPWNYPFQLGCRSVAPALAAGNTVVAKPASDTPLSFLKLAKIMEDAGVPKGVFNVVTGSGAKLGKVLVGAKETAGVVLTGSVPTGQELLREAAQKIVPVTLELGGKSPHVVFPDANLDKAVKGAAFGIFMNAGQMCWAGSRLLLHESIHDKFVADLVKLAQSWKLGNGLDKDTRMGPLVSRGHLKTVQGYVEAGKAEGATLATGGAAPNDPALANGNFLQPTIFTDVSPKMRIFREEIFGPVLSVTKFGSDDEALQLANAVDFGLYAGVWTSNLQRAHRFAAELESGQVAINEYPVTFPQTPFGGFKMSGIGHEQGAGALNFYTRTKSVMVNLG